MAQSKQGMHNSMLLECVRWDSEHVTLRDIEGEGEFVCIHSFCKANLRPALCFTISSAQGGTIPTCHTLDTHVDICTHAVVAQKRLATSRAKTDPSPTRLYYHHLMISLY